MLTIKEKLDMLVSWAELTHNMHKGLEEDAFRICRLTGETDGTLGIQLFGESSVRAASEAVEIACIRAPFNKKYDELGFWYRGVHFFTLVFKREVEQDGNI